MALGYGVLMCEKCLDRFECNPKILEAMVNPFADREKNISPSNTKFMLSLGSWKRTVKLPSLCRPANGNLDPAFIDQLIELGVPNADKLERS